MSYLQYNESGWYIRVETEGAFSFYIVASKNKTDAEKEAIEIFCEDFGFNRDECKVGYIWTFEEYKQMK